MHIFPSFKILYQISYKLHTLSIIKRFHCHLFTSIEGRRAGVGAFEDECSAFLFLFKVSSLGVLDIVLQGPNSTPTPLFVFIDSAQTICTGSYSVRPATTEITGNKLLGLCKTKQKMTFPSSIVFIFLDIYIFFYFFKRN